MRLVLSKTIVVQKAEPLIRFSLPRGNYRQGPSGGQSIRDSAWVSKKEIAPSAVDSKSIAMHVDVRDERLALI